MAVAVDRLSDHENFQHFQKNDDKGVYIAKPVIDRFRGEKIVLFSKRFNDANGVFIGMISVGVKLSYFQGSMVPLIPCPIRQLRFFATMAP